MFLVEVDVLVSSAILVGDWVLPPHLVHEDDAAVRESKLLPVHFVVFANGQLHLIGLEKLCACQLLNVLHDQSQLVYGGRLHEILDDLCLLTHLLLIQLWIYFILPIQNLSWRIFCLK